MRLPTLQNSRYHDLSRREGTHRRCIYPCDGRQTRMPTVRGKSNRYRPSPGD